MARAHVVTATAVLFALLASGCDKETKAYVECKGAGLTLADGMACTIDHQQGDSPVHVCWDMNIKCQNGAAGKAHGCGDVQPMAKSSVVLPFSAFGGALDKCDAISGSNVDGLVLTAAK